MRISASGLLSTIAVAIDQISRLAPSIRPVIEPVVSRTKATSTAGFATAGPTPDESARPARANASERKAGSVGSSSDVPSPACRFPVDHGLFGPKSGRGGYEIGA